MIRPLDAWAIRRELIGLSLNGEIKDVSVVVRPLIEHLAALPIDARMAAFGGYLCGRTDRDEVQAAIEAADPEAAAPSEEAGSRFATVADVRRLLADTLWTWEGWIPSGRIFGLGGVEGTGKTRTALDIHRRAWHGLAAPDGQAFSLDAGRPAIWVCSDGQHDEIAQNLPAFGLPDESVVFPTSPEEPFDGVDIDNPELMDPGGMLERAIESVKPWCVFIDSLTYATSRNLCEQHVMKGLKAPLVRLTQTYGVSIGLLLHLSREGQALGRRIRGITRTLIHLECSDPEGQPNRLKFWVEKSYASKPPPLGLTLGPDGNTYDSEPPRASPKRQGGRPPESREKARAFIVEALTEENDLKAAKLCEQWQDANGDKNTFWRARDAMVEAGELVCEGKPMIMHLVKSEADDVPDFY